MGSNPLEFKGMEPTKEDLEDWLGPGRFRRFDTIYDELVEMQFIAKLEWSKLDSSWFHRFYYKGKVPLFAIRWGYDFFYAQLVLKSDGYLKITNNSKVSSAALEVIRKFPVNRTKGLVRIEANLEKMNEYEGFFDLIPYLLKVV